MDGEAVEAARRTRQAFDKAKGKAMSARTHWHQTRVRELEGKLIDLIQGSVRNLVRQIAEVHDEAVQEPIPIHVELCAFPDVPLRLGSTLQGGIETGSPSQS